MDTWHRGSPGHGGSHDPDAVDGAEAVVAGLDLESEKSTTKKSPLFSLSQRFII